MIDKRILPQEKEIVGAWDLDRGGVKADEAAVLVGRSLHGGIKRISAQDPGRSQRTGYKVAKNNSAGNSHKIAPAGNHHCALDRPKKQPRPAA